MIVPHLMEFNQYIINSIYFDLRIQRIYNEEKKKVEVAYAVYKHP